jgi:DNA-binding HxlR family transcriptional regulator
MTASPPRPGRPVRGSTTGGPVMAALDLFGRRWTLRVLWELRDGAVGFRLLQQRKLMDRELRRRVRRFPPDGHLATRPPGQRRARRQLGRGLRRPGRPAGCRSR